jgi:hypothetical protein
MTTGAVETIGQGAYYGSKAVVQGYHDGLKSLEGPPETVPIILATLPTLTALLATVYTEPRESRASRVLNALGTGLTGAPSRFGKAVLSVFKSKPTPAAITHDLLDEGEPWGLMGNISDLPKPDLKRLAKLPMPTSGFKHSSSHAIPAWVPKSVAAELDFDPTCDVGGSAGPTCIPTTMNKHIMAANERNKTSRLTNSVLLKGKLLAYRTAKANADNSPSELLEYKAAYPEAYPFFVKEASGKVPTIVNVLSPFHEMEKREAGDIAESNLKALAKIAPPEMIYTVDKKNKSEFEDVKFTSIALLESLAFCGMKLTLDDPDCSPLRILGEIREFHAGQKALKSHLDTEESKRLTGPWAPIQRILNLISDYIGSKPSVAPSGPVLPTNATAATPPSSSAPSSNPLPPTTPLPPSTAIPYYIPPIQFNLPVSLSKSLAPRPRFSLPPLYGQLKNPLRIFR